MTALDRVRSAGIYDPSDYPKMTMIRYDDLALLVALADAVTRQRARFKTGGGAYVPTEITDAHDRLTRPAADGTKERHADG